MNILLADFERWKGANPSQMGLYDYMHGVFLEGRAPPDLAFAFFKLIRPDFVEIDGAVFLRENYREERIKSIRDTANPGDLEFWINLTSLESILPESAADMARILTEELVPAWSNKLKADFPDKIFYVRCIEDDGEKYISFSQAKPSLNG